MHRSSGCNSGLSSEETYHITKLETTLIIQLELASTDGDFIIPVSAGPNLPLQKEKDMPVYS